MPIGNFFSFHKLFTFPRTYPGSLCEYHQRLSAPLSLSLIHIYPESQAQKSENFTPTFFIVGEIGEIYRPQALFSQLGENGLIDPAELTRLCFYRHILFPSLLLKTGVFHNTGRRLLPSVKTGSEESLKAAVIEIGYSCLLYPSRCV